MCGLGRLPTYLVAAAVVAGCDSPPAPAPPAAPSLEPGKGRYWDDLPEGDGDPDRLAGRWSVVWQEVGEMADPAGVLFGGFQEVEFAGGRCRLTSRRVPAGPEAGGAAECAVTFDPGRSPKWLDLKCARGRMECIYKVVRDGRLLIALGGSDEEGGQPWRPPAFNPSRSQAVLLVCERERP